MITTFEIITQDLTEKDRPYLNVLLQGFATKTKKNPITEKELVIRVNSQYQNLGLPKRITGVKVRKLVNFIRVNAMLPLIATSKGYYISYDKEEIANQIKSLQERSNSILSASNGLNKFL